MPAARREGLDRSPVELVDVESAPGGVVGVNQAAGDPSRELDAWLIIAQPRLAPVTRDQAMADVRR